jgi:hypothetical protein
MLNNTEIIQLFAKRGVTLKLKGDTIEVSPRALITDKMRNFIIANKTILIATLKKNAREKTVTCNECDNFTPDPIGFGGIGTCAIGEKAWLKIHSPMPPYPYAERKCEYFLTKKSIGET